MYCDPAVLGLETPFHDLFHPVAKLKVTCDA